MKHGTSVKYALLLFLILIVVPAVSAASTNNTERKTVQNGRILFISSYSYGWDTVQIQIDGIKKGIRQGTTVDYEFMDTKRFSDENSLRIFYKGLKYRLDKLPAYDAIILGDDAALLFAVEHRAELFPDTPLIFEGVNNETLAMELSKDPLITGVLEKLSVQKNIDFARTLYPDAKNVIGIFDNSITGQAEREKFYQNAELYPDLKFEEINTSKLTSSELCDALASVNTDSILIYVVMTEDASGKQYTNSESIQLISQHAKVPAFRMVSGGIGEGLLGGNIVSMERSGKIAADIAMAIIDGTPASDFDVVVDSPNVYCVDETVMKQFNLDLSLIPDDAEIINHEETFWERNQEVMLPGLIIISLLLIIITLALLDNILHRRLSRELSSAKQELENAYYQDALTGLSNRICFKKDLLRVSEENRPFALMMIDLDNFKHINDTYGHSIGDEALRQIGERLLSISTATLTPYRFAGDEFIVIAKFSDDITFRTEAACCLNIFQDNFDLKGIPYTIHGSIGISISPQDTRDTEDLVVYADAAMYHIKRKTKNACCFYSDMQQANEPS